MWIENINSAKHLSNFWNFFIWHDPNDFLSRLVTMDRTWSVTQRQSNNQWSGSIAACPAPPRPKTFRVQKSAGKVLALIFWDQDGIIDYLPKGQIINAEYYSSLCSF
jgi:hypothetical protein